MTHWTLILTIVINWSHATHSKIEQIDGFTSKATCEIAGRSWKNDLTTELQPVIYNAGGTRWGRAYSWTCVGM